MPGHWLVKTEPDVYSFETLLKEKRTHWNGVRNFQARNYLKAMKAGDFVLVYHSQGPKSVVGIACVVKEAYPDPYVKADDPKGEWVMVDLEALKPVKKEVTLAQIKAEKSLATVSLIKQSRLSVMPLATAEFKKILALSGTEI